MVDQIKPFSVAKVPLIPPESDESSEIQSPENTEKTTSKSSLDQK